MLNRALILIFALLTYSLRAQQTSTNQAEETAIERVKTTQVSSLDHGLPKVTLEFFLQYEGEGAPIKWRTRDCGQLKVNRFIDREPHATTACVEAEIDLKDDRSATIVVSVATAKTGSAGVPRLLGVTVGDRSGTHMLRGLSDLPAELHRPLPKWPRDLPVPAGAALRPHAVASNYEAS